MACGACCFLPLVTFEAGFFWRPEGGRIMGVVVNVVVARCAGVLQLVNMEAVGNGDTVRIDLGGSSFHLKNTFMTADAVWIDLVEFGRKTCMLPSALKGKNVNAWHQGMACRMTLRAVNLRMQGRLLPKGRFLLLMMTGDAEFLLGRRIRWQGHRGIKSQYGQHSA
jgi:hypothetical protein